MDQRIYPLLAGTYRERPIWPSAHGADQDPKVVNDLFLHLRRARIQPEDLDEVSLPLLHSPRGHAGEWSGYWLETDQTTIDSLITTQVHGRTEAMISTLSHKRQRSDMPAMLASLPSLSHCAAFWGVCAGNALSTSYADRYASPTGRTERDVFDYTMHRLERWCEPHTRAGVPLRRENYPTLHHTPAYPKSRVGDTVYNELLGFIAARIAYCLSRYRPVLIRLQAEAPSDAIATLISHAQKRAS